MIRHAVCLCTGIALLSLAGDLRAADPPPIQVSEDADAVHIETDALKATLPKRGYVSGVKAGTLIDKKTGAHDLGFGLHIMDFLLAPGWADDEYSREKKYHGDLPKHLVEGPQICTQAKELPLEIIRGPHSVAIRTHYTFTTAAKGMKPGSRWEQILVFVPKLRYFFSAERITSVNDVDDLFYRIDMPGHIRHKNGDTFEQVYLSYHGLIPAKEFVKDFAPDEKFLYKRQDGKVPERMIRGYQIKLNGKPGPWLAGVTLDPSECSEAWCHQRGYVCFIEELHRKKVKAGDTIGAAYIVGFFDDISEIESQADSWKSIRAIDVCRGANVFDRNPPQVTPVRLRVGETRELPLFDPRIVAQRHIRASTSSSDCVSYTVNPTSLMVKGLYPGESQISILDLHRRFDVTVIPVFPPAPLLKTIGRPLPGTAELTAGADQAEQMVSGIDGYLVRELSAAPAKRAEDWAVIPTAQPAETKAFVAEKQRRLRKMLGIVGPLADPPTMEIVATAGKPLVMLEHRDYRVSAVRWPVLPKMDGEGYLIEPTTDEAGPGIIIIPEDATNPADLPDLARFLASKGCRVLVPILLDQECTWSGNPTVAMTDQSHREFVYRMAFELGRHPMGFETQKVLAGVEWLARQRRTPGIGIIGQRAGGTVALVAAALDDRVRSVATEDCLELDRSLWKQPVDRNIWGVLREFGDGELAWVASPVFLAFDPDSPSVLKRVTRLPDRRRCAADCVPDLLTDFRIVMTRTRSAAVARDLTQKVHGVNGPTASFKFERMTSADELLHAFLKPLNVTFDTGSVRFDRGAKFDWDDQSARQHRQFTQLVDYTQKLMRDAERRRAEFWGKVKLPAKPDGETLTKWQADCKPYREYFWEEVIGKLPPPTLPMNPKSRQVYDEPRWNGYEVTLDLYPEVFAYGILLLPKDLKPGERRPVVVCQHGLEGRPTDVVNPRERTRAYNSFGARLADLGYIVYAPQNPYIGGDTFRMLQRKANPLKLSIFSFIVRQHERTLDWLSTLPNVDPDRIAFYGLSYGGKTAMRVPAILPKYCLSICSGDFNEWTWKNCSVDFPASYMFTGEWEMPEFDIGNTFGYAEMANLIAPRPFMVERGHDDGVGIDEWVAYEYAKVRRTYDKLGIGDRTEIEFFNGGHECHCEGTFAFLKKHLHWPK